MIRNQQHPVQDEHSAIVLIDLDCFYAQVEANRCGLDDVSTPSPPLVVQQWGRLLAVNYEARKWGIKRRLTTLAEAVKLCPALVTVHVDTIDGDGVIHTHAPNTFREDKNGELRAIRKTHKATLTRYREASDKIFTIFSRFTQKVQKQGIDEAYLDLTDAVHEKLKEQMDIIPEDWRGRVLTQADNTKREEKEEGKQQPQLYTAQSQEDQLLLIASHIVEEIRLVVKQELRFNCSAGIAHNKILAKIGASFAKPNGQMSIPTSKVNKLLENLPLTKLTGFGGLLGEELKDMNLLTATDVFLRFSSLDALESAAAGSEHEHVRSHASFVWDICHGVNHDLVKRLVRPESMSRGKRVTVNSFSKLMTEFRTCVVELLQGLELERKNHLREPKTISLSWWSTIGKNLHVKTLPHCVLTRDEIIDQIRDALSKLNPEKNPLLPCGGIQVTASKFAPVETSAQGDSISDQAISRFCITKHNNSTKCLPKSTTSRETALLSSTLPSSFRCLRCYFYIREEDRQEHGDYHIAHDLANRVIDTKTTTSCNMKNKKRQKPHSEEEEIEGSMKQWLLKNRNSQHLQSNSSSQLLDVNSLKRRRIEKWEEWKDIKHENIEIISLIDEDNYSSHTENEDCSTLDGDIDSYEVDEQEEEEKQNIRKIHQLFGV